MKIRWGRGCPADQVMTLLKGRWRLSIIGLLAFEGPQRFNAARRRMPGVSIQILTQTLRGMERDGLVLRRDYGEKPLRVEYSLTPRGRSLSRIVHLMHVWRDRPSAIPAARLKASRGRRS